MKTLTTTLEMSKKLKLAGWSKETYFYCVEVKGSEQPIHFCDIEHNNKPNHPDFKIYDTPTITELLEEISNSLIIQYVFSLGYSPQTGILGLMRSPDKLADCWIWAKQKNLLGRDKER